MSLPREVLMVPCSSTHRRPRAWHLVAGSLLGLMAVASGCSSGNPATVGGGVKPIGTGGSGDAAAAITACAHDAPGCACQHEGAVIQCGVQADSDAGTSSGTVKCAMGGQICAGGQWSACLTNTNDPSLRTTEGLKVSTGVKILALSPGVACANNPCDPYCFAYPDTAGGIDAGGGSVTTLGCGDGSVLTVGTSADPDASIAPTSVLKDAGLADGEQYIFIQLSPGQTTPRNIPSYQTKLAAADIYFLIDDTASMGPASSNLATALTAASGGLISAIKCVLGGASGNVNFGVGRFEDFQQAPYVYPAYGEPNSTNPYNLPYQNILSLQNDLGTITPPATLPSSASICGATGGASCTAAAVTWMTIDGFGSLVAPQTGWRSGGDIPEASVTALYQIATGGGLFNNNSVAAGRWTQSTGPVALTNTGGTENGSAWWMQPRVVPWNSAISWWPGSPMKSITDQNTSQVYPFVALAGDIAAPSYPGVASPCGAGTLAGTYPCFHQSSTPIIVMLSDAPAHDGPGGQYPHVGENFSNNPGPNLAAQYSPLLTGANTWPIQPTTAAVATVPLFTGTNCPKGASPSSVTTDYDVPVQTGTGGTAATKVCSLTNGASNGSQFSNAVPLPVGANSLPIPGVYFGTVQNSARLSGTTSPFYSATSVGSGVYSLPTITASVSNGSPGGHYRNSLRDCVGQGGSDDGLECTPGFNTPVTYTCFDGTAAGSVSYSPSALQYSPAATVKYTPTAPTPAATPTAPTNASTVNAAWALQTGASTAPVLTSIGSDTTYALSNYSAFTATTQVGVTTPTATDTAATYNYAAAQTVVSFKTLAANITTAQSVGSTIALANNQSISNVTVTLNNITPQGAGVSVTARATVGGTPVVTSGAVTTLNGVSTPSGAYFPGTAGATVGFTVTQSVAGLPGSDTVAVTVTYTIGTAQPCAVNLLTSLLQYPATGGTATTGGASGAGNQAYCAACPVTTPATSWTGSACAAYCPTAAGTQGTGLNGSSTATCYTCPGGVGNLSTGTNPWSCAQSCSGGDTLATATVHGSNTTGGQCYHCSTGGVTPTTNGTVWGCGYNTTGCAANSAPALTTHDGLTAGQCYSCVAGGTNFTPSTTPAAAAWTCPAYECVGAYAGWTLGGAGASVNTLCYSCPNLTSPGAGYTTTTLDLTNGPQCSTCPNSVFAGEVLDVGVSPYKCESCTGAYSAYTISANANNAAQASVICTGTVPSCDAPNHWLASGANCQKVDACNATTTSGFTVTPTNDVVGGGPSGGWQPNCGTSSGYSQCTGNNPANVGAVPCWVLGQSTTVIGTGTPVAGDDKCFCELVTPGAGAITYSTHGNNCTGGSYVAGTCDNPCPATAVETVGTGTSTVNISSGTTCTTSPPTTAGTGGHGYAYCATTSATTNTCTTSGTAANNGGDGYYGNDIIYKFTVPAGTGYGARYYYHFALLRYGPDATSTWATGGPATGGAAQAQTAVKPFLYLKSGNANGVNDTTATTPFIDKTYPYILPKGALASDDSSGTGTYGGTVGSANGPVLDCNKSAFQQLFMSDPTPTSDYVLSEIDGYVPPGTYYLVVDNLVPTTDPGPDVTQPPTYSFFLQVGGFDDAPANPSYQPAGYTQPSYAQTLSALSNSTNLPGLKFIAVENSGLSCLQPNDTYTQSTAQYETRDYMEKLAYDLGSYDSSSKMLPTIRPYVVPVRKDGSSCNPPCTAGAATCGGSGAGSCKVMYPNGLNPADPTAAPTPLVYDPDDQACTNSCTTTLTDPITGNNPMCPTTAPFCASGGYCTLTAPSSSALSQCTVQTGLTAAVAAAVQNVAGGKGDVWLRPVPVNSGQTYVAPGAACTTSASCSAPTPVCYGGSCTVVCTPATAATACGGTNSLCAPSTIANDPNWGYCVSPRVFVYSVVANSTDIPGTPPTGTDALCGVQPYAQTCTVDANCTSFGPLYRCLAKGPAVGWCGIPDTVVDSYSPPPYPGETPALAAQEMFKLCQQNAAVGFDVTFQMPFARSTNAQTYEFDLVTYFSGNPIGRTRVILENPSLAATNFYRDYDASKVCGAGTHAVWGNLTYQALCPSNGATPFSQSSQYSDIRFCASTGSSPDAGFGQLASGWKDSNYDAGGGKTAGGCAPGEVLVGVATANPDPSAGSGPGIQTGGWYNTCPATGTPGMGYSCAPTSPTTATPAAAWSVCTGYNSSGTCKAAAATTAATAAGWAGGCSWIPQMGFNVGTVLLTSSPALDAGLATSQYLRIRMEFDPNMPGGDVAPWLYSWNLDVDCMPTE